MNRAVFELFYLTGLARIAWHTEVPTSALKTAFDAGWLQAGQRVLEVGCGLGTNCEWLAQRGCKVTGIDMAEVAVRKTRKRLRRKSLSANLYQADFLRGLNESPFDVVVARATLHSFPRGRDRTRFAQNLAQLVKPTGSLLLVEMQRLIGRERPNLPPFALQLSDLEELFAPQFKIEQIGEEVQYHRVRGKFIFGQWHLASASPEAADIS